MAVKTAQTTLSSTAAAVATPANGGSPLSPQPMSVKNIDASIDVYIGGSDVTTANGFKLGPSESYDFDGTVGDVLYAVAASGTPKVSTIAFRS